jgi:DNA-binding YbaB/EbfC family protein
MLKQVMEMKGRIEGMRDSLAGEQVEGTGGGMVKVVINGKFEVLSVMIDPSLIKEGEVEIIQSLVQAAMNDAVHNVQDMVKEKMRDVTGGIEIPGITC